MSRGLETLAFLTLFQYYDSENISEARLSFRRATSEPQTHGGDDVSCMKVLYDMDRCVARYLCLHNPAN